MHPIWEVRVGAFGIFEKYQFLFPESNFRFIGREDHLASFKVRFNIQDNSISEGNVLIFDSSFYPTQDFLDEIYRQIETTPERSVTFSVNGNPVCIYLSKGDYSKNKNQIDFESSQIFENELFGQFYKYELEHFSKLNYLHDAIYLNSEAIRSDAKLLRLHRWLLNPKDFPTANFVKPEEIIIGKNVQIHPGCVLDGSNGPIILDDNVSIMAQATIIGPAYVGKNSTIKIGTKIYQDNSFGEWCKVGGEIENSIIQSYSNKQHEGFLGHSFLCEWVNLGADTNTSDLKNTYTSIKINLEDREINTGKIFLGLLCGDHTKSGINTMFTTGTVAGICGILVREWFLPNSIPSFSWGGAKTSPIYKVAKAIETAKIVMQRRSKELSQQEEKLILAEYEKVKSRF
jgi:UDP-N-acetylglucosamine diphosphorylase/glucosamine-1-phosphate N-acetyltransferase